MSSTEMVGGDEAATVRAACSACSSLRRPAGVFVAIPAKEAPSRSDKRRRRSKEEDSSFREPRGEKAGVLESEKKKRFKGEEEGCGRCW